MSMGLEEHWMLPDGVEDLLPNQVRQIEKLRAAILQLFDCWGYDRVVPPLMEYTDALLTGVGSNLDVQTFKFTDRSSGRMLGIRADMTPQAARIDAHRLKHTGSVTTRLCYLGPVLRTLPKNEGGSRNPIQLGAELFGHAGVESDIEVIRLMLAVIHATGLEQSVHLDLGHVGIYRALVEQAGLNEAEQCQLFDAFQRKATTEIDDLISQLVKEEKTRTYFYALKELNGGIEMLEAAKKQLSGAGEKVERALNRLERVANAATQQNWGVHLHIDLAELRGYDYHTGLLFAVYIPGKGEAVAQGGRYDHIGEQFGRARPATGFSADLRDLVALQQEEPVGARSAIFAPVPDSEAAEIAQQQKIDALRNAGERVICGLPREETDTSIPVDCDLVWQDEQWSVVSR